MDVQSSVESTKFQLQVEPQTPRLRAGALCRDAAGVWRLVHMVAAINGTNRCDYVKMMETRVSNVAADARPLRASEEPAVLTFPQLKYSL